MNSSKQAELIRDVLHRAADIASEYLGKNHDSRQRVLQFLPPDKLAALLDIEPGKNGKSFDELFHLIEDVVKYSVRTGHPSFYNQLYGGYDLPGIVGEWITAILNTSMYTYEVAPVFTLLETALISKLAQRVGFSEGEGVLTPGGSVSNLMAVLVARNHLQPRSRQEGLHELTRMAMFTSDVSHYSLKRAANVVGLGLDSVIPVSTDESGCMIPESLEEAIQKRIAQYEKPFFVCATAGTTVQAAYDPIESIAEIARRYGMWLHVDAAYGGGVFLSRKHRHLAKGSHLADSLTWCPHKMMGVPLLCSAFLVKERGLIEASNAIEADYLFHDDCEDIGTCDLGHLSLQCGRRVDALKLYLSWQALGDDGLERRIDRKFELAAIFREMIIKREGFYLAREPMACNICFHYIPDFIFEIPEGNKRDVALDRYTRTLRRKMLEEGRVLINFAPLDGVATFRIVMNNAQTTENDLKFALDEIERLGRSIKM